MTVPETGLVLQTVSTAMMHIWHTGLLCCDMWWSSVGVDLSVGAVSLWCRCRVHAVLRAAESGVFHPLVNMEEKTNSQTLPWFPLFPLWGGLSTQKRAKAMFSHGCSPSTGTIVTSHLSYWYKCFLLLHNTLQRLGCALDWLWHSQSQR